MSLIVSSGGKEIQVSLADNEMEELRRKVATEFSLHPESFDLFDEWGKVDARSLKRSVSSAGEVACRLNVQLLPHWQKMHQMEHQMERLNNVTSSIMERLYEAEEPTFEDAALERLEARILAKVDVMLMGMKQEMKETFKQIDGQVSGAIAPMVQTMAMDQIDLKAQLESLETKVNAVAPMLQNMAIDQIDIKEKIDNFEVKANNDLQLCQDLVDIVKATKEDVTALKQKVADIDEKPDKIQGATHWTVPISSPSIEKRDASGDLQWLESTKTELFPQGISWSAKKSPLRMKDSGGVSFTAMGSPLLQRSPGCRSMPSFLPPVK